MTNTPRVTVAMPVYNGSKTLHRAIRSVLAQTLTDFELLIIDDGSTDDSVAVAESFRDPRVRLLVHEQNRGLAAIRNHLVEESRGDYTAWLDADDWAHPERLELQVQALNSVQRAVICGARTRLLSDESPSRPIQLLNVLAERGFTDSRDLQATMPFRNALSTSSVMLKTEVVRANELTFNHEFAPAEDYKMWTQIINFGDAISIPQTLTKVFSSTSGASSQNRERQLFGARRTRLEMLDNLGFDLNEDETSAHVFLTERISIAAAVDDAAGLEDYSQASWWLDEIQNRNARLAALDRNALRRACAEKFISLAQCCARSYPRGLIEIMRDSRSSRSIPSWALHRVAAALD